MDYTIILNNTRKVMFDEKVAMYKLILDRCLMMNIFKLTYLHVYYKTSVTLYILNITSDIITFYITKLELYAFSFSSIKENEGRSPNQAF